MNHSEDIPAESKVKRQKREHGNAYGKSPLLKMWSRVKGDNASAWTYILICIVFAGLITLVILKYTRKAYRQRSRRKKYSKKKRK